jgi:hypothetical protein
MAPPRFPACIPADCDPTIRLAVEYWLSIHPTDGLPGRQHFDPVNVPALLPYVRLVDVVGSRPKFRIRLMGTRTVAFFERDLTGYWYHDAFTGFPGSEAERTMTAVVQSAQPVWRKGPSSLFLTKDYQDIERVILPLATDGRNVDLLLIVHVYS